MSGGADRLPFVIIGNIKLSPETIRSFQQSQDEARRSAQTAAEDANTTDEPRPETEAEKIADGTHCISGWDLTFPPLKDAIKAGLRNPSSFEHISTSWSHMSKDGKFGLVMKYRAQNGFGSRSRGISRCCYGPAGAATFV